MYGLTQELSTLQGRYFPDLKIPVEFHAHGIHGSKDHRFKHLTPTQRQALLHDAYSVVKNAGFPSVFVFASAIHVTAVQNAEQSLRDCLEDICIRFNKLLELRFKMNLKDKGLLILDKSGRDRRVRALVNEFSEQGTKRGYLGNIIDTPYFADSAHTRMLQLADLVAYAVNRCINRDDCAYLDLILDRVARAREGGCRGPIVGLNHILGAGHSCKCGMCKRVEASRRSRKPRRPRRPTRKQ